MGVNNWVTCTVECPRCHKQGEFRVQFRYGETWEHDYEVLDRVGWSGNPRLDYGNPEYKRVVVDGFSRPCAHCGEEDDMCFDVFFNHSQITSVKPHSDEYDFNSIEDDFIILQE